MSNLRARVLVGILSICFMSGAFAAEVYVSLGLGVAEDQVDLHSTAPAISERCSASLVSVSCAGGLSIEPVTAEFELANTVASTASLGFEWESWRLEMEYSGRDHDGQSLPLPAANPFSFLAGSFGAGAVGGTTGRPIGFFSSEEPRHEIAGLSSHQIFLNALYSFRTGVSWRPYVGLGAGVARVGYRYIAEGIQFEVLPPSIEPGSVPEGAFVPNLLSPRTVTTIDAESRDNVLGFQILAGIDRTLSEEVSAFATLRWSRFEASAISNFSSDQSVPGFAAIGFTAPTSAPDELDGIGGFSLTAGIRYTF